jgi:acyl dehydratase
VALNSELVGKVYPREAFRLDPNRVGAFARAVGHPGGGVPPTMVTAPELAAGLANLAGDPELGLDYSRVVHAEQEYEWRRPLSVGETITAEATIEDVRAKGGLEFLVLRTDIRDAAGATVALGRSTIIVRAGG